MKKILIHAIYVTLLFLLVSTSLFAQTNRPIISTGPTGTVTAITLPQAYNAFGAPSFYNYIQQWSPLKPLTDTSISTFNLGSSNGIPVTTNYFDGYGQPLMSILHGNNATHSKDLIYPSDNRPSLNRNIFLPYAIPLNSHFQMNPFSDQFAYYLSMYPNEGYTAYTRDVVPDDQSTQQSTSYAPGRSFTGVSRGVTTLHIFNDTSESIVKYFVNTSGALDGFGTFYSSGDLSEIAVSGQHGEMNIQYIDKLGQLVCRKQYSGVDKHGANVWLSTYYAYNNLGKLCYTLPPVVSAANPTAGTFSGYSSRCFIYKYDQFGKITESNIPGKSGAIYNVYDSKYRPVLVQTPLLRAQGEWEFVIYDSRDRGVMTGILTDTNNHNTWQGWANGSVTPGGGVVSGSLLDFILNGFTGTYPSSITNCELRTFTYYDNYGWDAAFSSNTFGSIDNSDFFTDATAVAPTPYMFTHGMLTATKRKVVDPTSSLPNQWITSVFFYDQQGNVIQTQIKNPWNTTTWDTVTVQYNFSGQKILSVYHTYAWTGCTKLNSRFAKKYFYDNYARISQIQERADTGNWRIISTPSYDELGRLSSKNLGGVEQQDYTYNIRGQVESINADYLSGPLPDKTFGCTVSYDYGFDSVRFDGGIAGIRWRGAGTGSPTRAYGYNYDPAERLNYADFNQLNISGTWDKSSADFSMNGVTYDLNGNLLTMNQKGTSLSGPVDIDKLTYTYNSTGNQLQRVADAVTVDYGLGDFQDKTATTDYTYDGDGNLTSDFNKNITSISYNELDQPLRVQFNNGSIAYIYDANGSLLQKKIVDSSGASPHTDTYRYWGAFNFRNDSLLFVNHGEGRARWMADSSIFKYDFYVKDNLGNVRTIVTTDEGSPINYFADHELASAALESSIFANLDSVRDLKPGSTNPYDIQAAHLDGSDAQKRIGTALLMSVMAGDKFDISATSYYDTNSVGMSTYADGSSMLGAIIGSLVNGVGGYVGEGNNTSVVSSMFTTPNYLSIYEGVLDSLTDYTRPRAYINYLVFDNSMNLVASQSGAVQISGTPGSWQTIGTTGPITVGQNGYVSIYMSDEQYMPVFMDKMNITYYRGRLVQEQHYYPFGLPINPVTSSGTLPSKSQIEGNETNLELGLKQSDFKNRSYDYQLGRFTGVDPMADQAGQEMLSPYHFVGNNPAKYTDPFGLTFDPPSPGAFISPLNNTSSAYNGDFVDPGYVITNITVSNTGHYFVTVYNTAQYDVQAAEETSASSDNSGESSAAPNSNGGIDAAAINMLSSNGVASGSDPSGGTSAAGGCGSCGASGSSDTKPHRYAVIDKRYYDLFSFRDFYNRYKDIDADKYVDQYGAYHTLVGMSHFKLDDKPWKKHAEVLMNIVLTPGDIVTVGTNNFHTDNSLNSVYRFAGYEKGKVGIIHIHPVHSGVISWSTGNPRLFNGTDDMTTSDGPSNPDKHDLSHFDVAVDPEYIYIYNNNKVYQFKQ